MSLLRYANMTDARPHPSVFITLDGKPVSAVLEACVDSGTLTRYKHGDRWLSTFITEGALETETLHGRVCIYHHKPRWWP